MSGLYLYVVEFGDRTKIGVSSNVGRRLAQHQGAARAAQLSCRTVLVLEPHEEARANERTLLRQFGHDRSEYVTASADVVAAVARSLPQTPAEVVVGVIERGDAWSAADLIRSELAVRRLPEWRAAELIGVSYGTWRRAMAAPNTWRIGRLEQVANLLGMSMSEFIGRTMKNHTGSGR